MRVVILAPGAPERTFKRVVGRFPGAHAVEYGTMSPSDGSRSEFLAGEAERLVGEALGEPAHLVAYSGLAAVSLFIAARYPERIRTLTLIEPPWIGNDVWSAEEARYRAAFDAPATSRTRALLRASSTRP